MRVTNQNAPRFIEQRKNFRNGTWQSSSFYATTYPPFAITQCLTCRYVVYSYGPHWPLAVYEYLPEEPDNGVWYVNEDKRSATTSRHASLTRQGIGYGTPTVPLSVDSIKLVVDGGTAALMKEKRHGTD